MTLIHHCKKQIYSLLLILILTVGFNFKASFGHQCQPSSAPAVHESHIHHHHCDHSHGHHHHDHDLGSKKLPEELAEEEDLRLEYVSHHDHDHDHYHGGGSELTGVGLWIHAMGCSLLVSLASLVCLILLPLIFFQGKPSKALVDSLAIFGAGAMLGDAFLHQLPHAFGGGHSHSHDNHVDDVHHSHSHSHSIEDLSVGLSILSGIVVFLLVEKVVRYVEDMSGGVNSWGHGHHHHNHNHNHNHKKSVSLNDINGDDDNSNGENLDGSTSETPEKIASGESLNSDKQSESSHLRKRNTSTNAVGDKSAENEPKSNIKSSIEKEPAQSSSLVFGYLNLFSDGVHNFTDGMALGSAFLLYGSVGGWSRTLFLLAHELPQEIGDFGILVRSGFSVFKALFFNFLSALVALAGTALALLLGQDPGQSSLIEGFTAGGFIYIAVGVMAEMNNGSSSSSLKNSAIQLSCLVLGMSVALFISLIE